MIGIYKVTNLVNGKTYIGQSQHIETRWYSHKNDYNNPNSSGYTTMFYNAMRKYGVDNFQFEIIEECELNQLNEREQYWIQYYNSYWGFPNSNGYNMTLGGDRRGSNTKLKYEEVLEIQSLLINDTISQAEIGERYGVSVAAISNINLGKTWTDDELDYPLRKQRYRKGKPIKSTKKDLPVTKEELLQLIIENQGNFTAVGRDLNISRRTVYAWCKLLELPTKATDYYAPKVKTKKKKINPNLTGDSKPVYMLDKNTEEIIKYFNSMSEAGRFLNNNSAAAHIGLVCIGKQKTAYGYKWKWAEKE